MLSLASNRETHPLASTVRPIFTQILGRGLIFAILWTLISLKTNEDIKKQRQPSRCKILRFTSLIWYVLLFFRYLWWFLRYYEKIFFFKRVCQGLRFTKKSWLWSNTLRMLVQIGNRGSPLDKLGRGTISPKFGGGECFLRFVAPLTKKRLKKLKWALQENCCKSGDLQIWFGTFYR